MEIIMDNWNGSFCKEEVCEASSPQEILEIVEKLDAKRHTLVNFFPSENDYLMIGGGDGKYVITGEENGVIFNLTNSKVQGTEKVALNTGGQLGLFEPKYIISKELAFKCVLQYFSTGKIPKDDETLIWEKY